MAELNALINISVQNQTLLQQVNAQFNALNEKLTKTNEAVNRISNGFRTLFGGILSLATLRQAVTQFNLLQTAQINLADSLARNSRLSDSFTRSLQAQASALSRVSGFTIAQITRTQAYTASLGLAEEQTLALNSAIASLGQRTGNIDSATNAVVAAVSRGEINETLSPLIGNPAGFRDLTLQERADVLAQSQAFIQTSNQITVFFGQLNSLLANVGATINNILRPVLEPVNDLLKSINAQPRIAGALGLAALGGGAALAGRAGLGFGASTALGIGAGAAAGGLPAILKRIGALLAPIVGWLGRAASTLSRLAGPIAALVGSLIVIGKAIGSFLTGIKDAPAIQYVFRKLSEGVNLVVDAFEGAFETIGYIATIAVQSLRATFQALGEAFAKLDFTDVDIRAAELQRQFIQEALDKQTDNSREEADLERLRAAVRQQEQNALRQLYLNQANAGFSDDGGDPLAQRAAFFRARNEGKDFAEAFRLERELLDIRERILGQELQVQEARLEEIRVSKADQERSGVVDQDTLNKYLEQVKAVTELRNQFSALGIERQALLADETRITERYFENIEQLESTLVIEDARVRGAERLATVLERVNTLVELGRRITRETDGNEKQRLLGLFKDLRESYSILDEIEQLQDVGSREIRDVQTAGRRELLGDLGTFADNERAERDLRKRVLKEEIKLTTQLIDKNKELKNVNRVSELNEELVSLEEQAKRLELELPLLGSVVADNLGGAFDSLIDGTQSVKAAFGDMVRSILADITKLLARAAVLGLVGSAFQSQAGEGSAGLFSGLLNLFSGGRNAAFHGGLATASGIKRFAGGGIVPGPSISRDVVPAMLTPGELVLNAAQQNRVASHLVSQAPSITNINAFDQNDILSAIAQRQGQSVNLNVIRRNREQVRRMVR